MFEDGFEIKQSLFYKERDLKTSGKDKQIQSRIAPEVRKDLEDYFMKRYNTTEGVSSSFIHELIVNFLNSITTEKKSFEDLYIILLLPKTEDPDELEVKSEIIGTLQGDDVFFRNPFKFQHGNRNKFNFIFNVEDFNERNYNDLLAMYKKKDALFFNVDESIQDDFVKVKMRLSELCYDIDLDNCYFTVVNVNNYLDELHEGQYTSNWSSFHHEGVIVLLDPFNKLKRFCMGIDWACYHDLCEVFFKVIDEGHFNETILEQIDNMEIVEEYSKITQAYSYEHALKKRIEDDKGQIDYWTQRLQEHEELLKKHADKK